MRRPPRSPLFPYTTLFRSHHRSVYHLENGATIELEANEKVRKDTDRKSTRLNSSHRCISYAVFCLKKKIYVVSDDSCGTARRDKNHIGMIFFLHFPYTYFQ